MVYLITDDHYFAEGMMVFLKAWNVEIVHPGKDEMFTQKLSFQDVVFISLKNSKDLKMILSTDQLFKSRVFIFSDVKGLVVPINILSWVTLIPKHITVCELRELYNMSNTTGVLPLTNQQLQVLSFLYQGKSPVVIAKKMKFSEKTVSAHRKNALLKLGVKNTSIVIIYHLMTIISTVIEIHHEHYLQHKTIIFDTQTDPISSERKYPNGYLRFKSSCAHQ